MRFWGLAGRLWTRKMWLKSGTGVGFSRLGQNPMRRTDRIYAVWGNRERCPLWWVKIQNKIEPRKYHQVWKPELKDHISIGISEGLERGCWDYRKSTRRLRAGEIILFPCSWGMGTTNQPRVRKRKTRPGAKVRATKSADVNLWNKGRG